MQALTITSGARSSAHSGRVSHHRGSSAAGAVGLLASILLLLAILPSLAGAGPSAPLGAPAPQPAPAPASVAGA